MTRLRYASNFARNLESMEAICINGGYGEAFDRLLNDLTDSVVPNLERHPGMGRPFMSRAVDSMESERVLGRIASQLTTLSRDGKVREYVMTEYIVLYFAAAQGATPPNIVHLLAIKHQSQLGFNVGTLD